MNNGDSSLNNITWQSKTGWTKSEQKGVKANFESNADGTATIKLDGTDFLLKDSRFKFDYASKVVIDSQNDNTGSNGENNTITLAASKATEMTVDWVGSANFGGAGVTGSSVGYYDNYAALGKVQNLTLNLEDAHEGGNTDLFNIGAYNLVSAQNVTVYGGGESVFLGHLGTADGKNATPDLTLNATDVSKFSVGNMGVGLGYNIDANISASDQVWLGDITTATNAQSNNQGDVNLTVSGLKIENGVNSGAPINITGGELNIDFSGVEGTVGAAGAAVVLDAEESITYSGAAGADYVNVTGVGAGSSSNISTGSGDDVVTIGAGALKDGSDLVVSLGASSTTPENQSLTIAAGAIDASGGTATSPNEAKITVNLDSATGESLSVGTAAANTQLVVEINGAEAGDVIGGIGVGGSITQKTDASALLSKFGFSLKDGMMGADVGTSSQNGGVDFNSSASTAVYDGGADTLYLFNANTEAAATTCVVVTGIECTNLHNLS